MTKLIGALLILFSTGAIGFDKAAALEKRKKNLKDLKAAVGKMKSEMSFSKHEIADIFSSAANEKNKTASLISFAAKQIKIKPQNPEQIWEMAVHRYKNELLFSNSMAETIAKMFSGLGKTDYALQEKLLSRSEKTLENIIAQAEDNCKKNKKLYQSFGILAGIFVCVILM